MRREKKKHRPNFRSRSPTHTAPFSPSKVLLAARVHPEAAASSLTPAQADAVAAAIGDVCSTAAAVDADASRFPRDWIFHVRWDQRPGARAGAPAGAVSWITVGGRTTAYVPSLQKKGGGGANKGDAAAAAATAPPPPAPPKAGKRAAAAAPKRARSPAKKPAARATRRTAK